jgi:hypothetical protein
MANRKCPNPVFAQFIPEYQISVFIGVTGLINLRVGEARPTMGGRKSDVFTFMVPCIINHKIE